MANNSKMSKSASVEDLKDKYTQLEAEVAKLSGQMQEVLKRQEESQRRIEENSKAMDDKLSSINLMLERTLSQISGKNSIPNFGESSNGNKPNEDNHNRTLGKKVNIRNECDGVEPDFDMTSEEFNLTNSYKKERDKVFKNEPNRAMNIQLPRMKFPRFDGGDPIMWAINCEKYFEMFEVPEIYKSRMAIINFSEEVHEWYRCLTMGGPIIMPWEILVEEVMGRFKGLNLKNPVDEFKRVHQVGRVEEFIRKFERVKARLLWEIPGLDEEFFVAGFISGLKEEIRHTVKLFNPRGLNNVFQCALKVEAAQDSHMKRSKEVKKGYKFQGNPAAN